MRALVCTRQRTAQVGPAAGPCKGESKRRRPFARAAKRGATCPWPLAMCSGRLRGGQGRALKARVNVLEAQCLRSQCTQRHRRKAEWPSAIDPPFRADRARRGRQTGNARARAHSGIYAANATASVPRAGAPCAGAPCDGAAGRRRLNHRRAVFMSTAFASTS